MKPTTLALLALAACSTPPLPGPLASIPQHTAEEVLAPGLLGSVRAAMLDVPPSPALQRLIYGRTACAGYRGVNPLAILAAKCQGPVVGREWRVLFVTSACPTPTEPDWPAWIVTSTRSMPTPIDFSPYGAPGCWAVVSPDIIVPVPPVTGGMFIRSGGKTTLCWTPAPGSVGASHYFQFLTLSPNGWLVSPGVEVIVGSL